MKVIGYCLRPVPEVLSFAKTEDCLPAIPIGLLTEDGFVWQDGVAGDKQQCKQKDLPEPKTVPEGSWLGVEADGTGTVLSPVDETDWRVSRATKAIHDSMSLVHANALRSVGMMHAAAALVGLDLGKFQLALRQARRDPQEPLEVTVRAIAAELARYK